MPINITTIGGGTGSMNVLTGLKRVKSSDLNLNLAAIVTVSDSGGSAGELRDEFGILPPGDIRRAVAALAEDTELVRHLFEHRFKRQSRVQGHTLGNLLLTGLAEMTGDFEQAIAMLCEMFNVRGKVIPVTLDDTQLAVVLENGETIVGETNIDVPKHDPNLLISDAYLIGGGVLNPHAREAIENSDYIIIGPGDLYSSIVPNLLSEGMKAALEKSSAKIIYVCNIMTKHGETTGFEVIDFVNVVEKYIGANIIDFVLVNNGQIEDELAHKYVETEGKIPVVLGDFSQFQEKSYKIIERDLSSKTDFIRHDPEKLGRVINDFIEGWIK